MATFQTPVTRLDVLNFFGLSIEPIEIPRENCPHCLMFIAVPKALQRHIEARHPTQVIQTNSKVTHSNSYKDSTPEATSCADPMLRFPLQRSRKFQAKPIGQALGSSLNAKICKEDFEPVNFLENGTNHKEASELIASKARGLKESSPECTEPVPSNKIRSIPVSAVTSETISDHVYSKEEHCGAVHDRVIVAETHVTSKQKLLNGNESLMKPYICPHCNARFMQLVNFVAHKRICLPASLTTQNLAEAATVIATPLPTGLNTTCAVNTFTKSAAGACDVIIKREPSLTCLKCRRSFQSHLRLQMHLASPCCSSDVEFKDLGMHNDNKSLVKAGDNPPQSVEDDLPSKVCFDLKAKVDVNTEKLLPTDHFYSELVLDQALCDEKPSLQNSTDSKTLTTSTPCKGKFNAAQQRLSLATAILRKRSVQLNERRRKQAFFRSEAFSCSAFIPRTVRLTRPIVSKPFSAMPKSPTAKSSSLEYETCDEFTNGLGAKSEVAVAREFPVIESPKSETIRRSRSPSLPKTVSSTGCGSGDVQPQSSRKPPTEAIGSTVTNRRSPLHGRARACELCGRWFLSSNGLLWHRNMHLGLKPYRCANCGMAFSAHPALMLHRKRCLTNNDLDDFDNENKQKDERADGQPKRGRPLGSGGYRRMITPSGQIVMTFSHSRIPRSMRNWQMTAALNKVKASSTLSSRNGLSSPVLESDVNEVSRDGAPESDSSTLETAKKEEVSNSSTLRKRFTLMKKSRLIHMGQPFLPACLLKQKRGD